ncbi:MAG: prepilin-type N-terminal cleavage/methylation domain-containing protein, partial [bacterium]
MIKKLIKRKKGFTLIELLVVIAIIIILAAILLPYIINRVEDSRISRMTGEIRSLKTAALLYYNDLNVFPDSWDDLVVNPTSPNTNWKGPYIEKVP